MSVQKHTYLGFASNNEFSSAPRVSSPRSTLTVNSCICNFPKDGILLSQDLCYGGYLSCCVSETDACLACYNRPSICAGPLYTGLFCLKVIPHLQSSSFLFLEIGFQMLPCYFLGCVCCTVNYTAFLFVNDIASAG